MASKEEVKAREAEEAKAIAAKFTSVLSLSESVAQGASVNPKFRKVLLELIDEGGAGPGLEKQKGNLLYYIAGKCPPSVLPHRKLLVQYVMNDKIKGNNQLEGAFEYLKNLGDKPVDIKALEESAGVGVVITREQIRDAVADVLKQNEARLREERYRLNHSIFLGQVTRTLKWAEGAAVRAELEAQVEAMLGPKTEEDMKPVEKKKAPKAPKAEAPAAKGDKAAAPAAPADGPAAPPDDPYAFFPKPNQNNQVLTTINYSDGKVQRIANTPEQLATHLKETGGKVVTRFPPEPNGYLHIGHAKAMFVDFGMAAQYGGNCYLRFDDTNPEAEKQEYIDHILDIVTWMGWTPWKITYSSDYFQQLYELAVKLIKSGHAFVCHQTKDEIEECREKKLPSPWRDRPIEESLRLFEAMRRGLIDEGKATLRMKMDYKNENFNMFDLIAYRIKFQPHPHAGDKWCIYPTYEFTHCVVDSLENISHSLCTLEFETRRASYYWLLDALDIYKPYVWEYSRLNITNTVMSKRKLIKLVQDGYVKGWDDPRLLTLAGLRRRGVHPAAINAFCRDMGITRNENVIPMHKLEACVRAHMEATSPRALAVLRPLKLVLTNLPESYHEEVDAKVLPGRSEDSYKVPFSRVVYIEYTDFMEVDQKDFFGLAPGKSIMLRYAYPVTYKSHQKDASGTVTSVEVEADMGYVNSGRKPPKGVLNWVAEPRPGQEPLKFEARIYDTLFKSEDPNVHEDWLSDLNPKSLEVLQGCCANPTLAQAKPGDGFQFERLGYFTMDPDSKPGQALVFNRTVTLKESMSKQVAAVKENIAGGKKK